MFWTVHGRQKRTILRRNCGVICITNLSMIVSLDDYFICIIYNYVILTKPKCIRQLLIPYLDLLILGFLEYQIEYQIGLMSIAYGLHVFFFY